MSEPQHSAAGAPRKSTSNIAILVLGLWLGVLVGALILLVLAVNGVISVGFLAGGAADGTETVGKVNQPAGEFELQALDGGTVRLSDLRGKVVVVNFWATWCGPCIREMPMFQEYQDRYPNIVVLGVDEEETPEKVSQFIEQMGITYTIALDQRAEMGRAMRVSFLPTTIFIDEKGEIRFRHYGIMSEEQLVYYLSTLGAISE